jgi:hypothetical protein
VTTHQVGIALGRAEYLNGANYWILQPYVMEDNIAPREQFIPEAYIKRRGDGVRVQPKPPLGFHATREKGR